MSQSGFAGIVSAAISQYSADFPLNEQELKQLQGSGIHLPSSLLTAAPKRQAEYLAGRHCVQQALGLAGATPFHPAIGPDRSPVWPEGWIGSITHTRGFVAACVAPKIDLVGIGIDAEAVMDLPTAEKVRSRLLSDTEGWDRRFTLPEWVTLIFSAKESIYKCLRPLTGRFFGFHDAEIHAVHPEPGRFQFSLRNEIGGGFKPGWAGEGRFNFSEGRFHAAFELPRKRLPV